MTPHFSRDSAAVLAGLLAPLMVSAILLPWRASWSNTNVALLLVVVVVAVASIGNRFAGALAAVSAAAWFDFFFTRPYERFTIHGSADITTAILLLAVAPAPLVAIAAVALARSPGPPPRLPWRCSSQASSAGFCTPEQFGLPAPDRAAGR